MYVWNMYMLYAGNIGGFMKGLNTDVQETRD